MLEETRKFSPRTYQHATYDETYQSSFQHPTSASLVLLEHLIIRDMVDVAYDAAATHRRRRAERPTLDLVLLDRLRRANRSASHVPPRLAVKMKDLMTAASAPCAKDTPYRDDDTMFNLLELPNAEDYHGVILKMLYCRGRLQSTI